jgi:iron complex outermembrane receptor protein
VYRGFVPPHLGSGAIGGAVNLVTTDQSRWNQRGTVSDLEVFASYGSFDSSRQLISAWLQPWRVRVFTHASHVKTLGNFAFVNNNGTPVNLDDDVIVGRSNNDSESYGFLGRVETDIPGLEIASLTLDAYDRDQGVAGLGSHQSHSARYNRRRRIGHVKLETKPFLSNQFVLSGTGFYSQRTEQFSDREGTVALGRQDTDNEIAAWGGLGRGRWFVPRLPLSIDAVFEGRTEQFHPADKLAQTVGPDRWRRSYTAAVAGELYLLHQTLVLSAVHRWERYLNEFWDEPRFPWLPPTPQGRVAAGHRSPSAGLRWTPARAVTIKGNVGRYYRLPTFLELFGNLGSVTGNSDLEPEEGFNRDIGAVVELEEVGMLRRVFLEVVYLDNEVSNLILFFPNSQQTTKPTNIGSAVIRGWECSIAMSVGARLRFSANYTRLHSEDTSDIPYYNGNQLPGRPRNDVMLVATYRSDRWKLTWEGHYIGANYLDRANMKDVPARNLHNVILQLVMPVRGLALIFEARNLTDDRVSDVSGFPLPGRSFYATASYQM